MLTAGQAAWLNYWSQLITKINADPVASKRILVDILNEPDYAKLEWSAANGLPGAASLTFPLRYNCIMPKFTFTLYPYPAVAGWR